jgi:hypothetical protein
VSLLLVLGILDHLLQVLQGHENLQLWIHRSILPGAPR